MWNTEKFYRIREFTTDNINVITEMLWVGQPFRLKTSKEFPQFGVRRPDPVGIDVQFPVSKEDVNVAIKSGHKTPVS